METDESVWGNVVVRLGPLATDERSNVRCNLAMLAAALAPTDRRAFDALVDIAVTAISRLLREEAGAEKDVLETIIDERETLPDKCKALFDSTVATRLVESDRDARFGLAVEGMLRLPSRALYLLPPQVMAAAILNDGRRLAAESARTEDALERDRRRDRLVRISEIFKSTLPEVREEIQAELGKEIAALGWTERRAVVRTLLLAAPRLLAPSRLGRYPLPSSLLCGGACLARPTLKRLIGQSLVRGMVPAACLTVLVALKVVLLGSFDDDGSGVLGAGLELSFIGFAAALEAGLAFVPSVGRFLSGFQINYFNIRVALFGAIAAIAISLLFFSSIYSDKEVPSAAPVWGVFEMFLVLIPTLCLAAPTVQYFRSRYADFRWVLMHLCVAGPGIVIASGVAIYAMLNHDGLLAPFWPMAFVCSLAVAATVVAREAAAWPAPAAALEKPQSPRWGWILSAAGVIPVLVVATGLVHTGMVRWTAHLPALTVPEPGRKLRMRQDRRVVLNLGKTPTVRVGIDPGAASYPILDAPGGDKPTEGVPAAAGSTTRQFVSRSSTAIVCLNTCGPTWPPMTQWWLVLWGNAPVMVTVQIIPPLGTKHANTAEDLEVSPSGVIQSVPVKEGGLRALTLKQDSHLTLQVKGVGNFGSASSLAIYSRGNDNDTWTVSYPPLPYLKPVDHFGLDLRAGEYRLCVYFGGADFAGCPVNNAPTAGFLFEPGTAALSGNVVPLHPLGKASPRPSSP